MSDSNHWENRHLQEMMLPANDPEINKAEHLGRQSSITNDVAGATIASIRNPAIDRVEDPKPQSSILEAVMQGLVSLDMADPGMRPPSYILVHFETEPFVLGTKIATSDESNRDFTPFPRLPFELREKIWELTTAKDRVVEVRRYNMTWGPVTPPPAVLSTCRESREVGLKTYRQIFVAEYNFSPRVWFGSKPDILYINKKTFYQNHSTIPGASDIPTCEFSEVALLLQGMNPPDLDRIRHLAVDFTAETYAVDELSDVRVFSEKDIVLGTGRDEKRGFVTTTDRLACGNLGGIWGLRRLENLTVIIHQNRADQADWVVSDIKMHLTLRLHLYKTSHPLWKVPKIRTCTLTSSD